MTTTDPVAATSTVEQVHARLRAEILRGELTPGTPLREQDLSRTHAVGRNSLRAALQSLAHEGLVTQRPNKGAVVREFGLTDIDDLFGVRLAVECEAAREVARLAPRLDAPREALAALEALASDTPWDVIVETDMAVHRSVVQLLGNPRLTRLHAQLACEVQLLQSQVHRDYPDPVAQLGVQHSELVDALASGDPAVADTAFRKHLETSRREVVLTYRRHCDEVAGTA